MTDHWRRDICRTFYILLYIFDAQKVQKCTVVYRALRKYRPFNDESSNDFNLKADQFRLLSNEKLSFSSWNCLIRFESRISKRWISRWASQVPYREQALTVWIVKFISKFLRIEKLQNVFFILFTDQLQRTIFRICRLLTALNPGRISVISTGISAEVSKILFWQENVCHFWHSKALF